MVRYLDRISTIAAAATETVALDVRYEYRVTVGSCVEEGLQWSNWIFRVWVVRWRRC